MTKEEIIEMAKKADLTQHENPHFGTYTATTVSLMRFAKLVAEHEREVCANVCDVEFHKPMEILIKDVSTYENGWIEGCKTCFEKIYARGQE